MVIKIITSIPGCAVQTTEPSVATAFLGLLNKAASPKEWMDILIAVDPNLQEIARTLLVNCLGQGA